MDADYPKFQRFRSASAGPEEAWDLFACALAIAESERPDFDGALADERVQALADELLRRRIGPEDGEGAVRALATFLFQEVGFGPPDGDEPEPAASYLQALLETRRGLPITLTVLFIEVARRIGIEISGVGFPGHFLARYDGRGALFLDPSDGGRTIPGAALRARLETVFHGRVRMRDEFLSPAPKRMVLVRILRNLQNAHMRRGEWRRALEDVERILLLVPDDEPARYSRRQLEARAGKR